MTIHFPDVSHHNGTLRLTGALAIIAKATQGEGYRDPTFEWYENRARTLDVPFVAYHWVDTDPIADQAANARVVAGNTPLMWDAEAEGVTVSRLVALTNALRAVGGNPRLVYLPHWWWERIGSPDLRPLAAAGLALVSSNYPTDGYTENGPGWTPYGGLTPTIWQYTSTGRLPGTVGALGDMNAYRGTIAELRAFLNGPTPEGPTVPDLPNLGPHLWHLICRQLAVTFNAPRVKILANAEWGVPVELDEGPNLLHDALAHIAAGIDINPVSLSPEQLHALVDAVTAGARAGAAAAIDGATIHTT